jgi:DNA-binding NarL/FixJ family response regulator
VSESTKLRLLIADDHPIFRDGLKAIVEGAEDMEVIGEASDGRAAVRAYKDLQPDVVLMDLRMPLLDGADAIAAILRTAPEAKILVLTTMDGDADIQRALRNGARGYLLKDAFREEILAGIRAVGAGKKHVSPAAATRLAEHPLGHRLTEREIEVLEHIAQGRSNREIGEALSITEGTVKTHVNSILDKLEAADRTEAAMTALKRGIIRFD